MSETLWYIMLFFGLGLLLWGASLRWGLRDYRKQPLQWRDLLYAALGAIFIGLFETILSPHLSHLLYSPSYVNSAGIQLIARCPVILQFLFFVVLTDFLLYWAHRLMHTKHVWRFHAFHHSPTSVNWLSGMRGGPVHYLIDSLPSTIATCVLFFTGNESVILPKILIDVFFQHWNHSALEVPGAKLLEYIFVTPRYHFLHHHPERRFTHSNYGVMFSLWDRLFRTYTPPEAIARQGRLGLDYTLSDWSLLLGTEALRPSIVGADAPVDADPTRKAAS